MNTHPWIGLPGNLRSTHCVLTAVGPVTDAEGFTYVAAIVYCDDNHADDGRFVDFHPDDPTEARRRLQAAGAPTLTVQAVPAPVDYEAIGRGAVREAIAAMSGPGGLAVRSVYQRLAESIGRGIASARGGAS